MAISDQILRIQTARNAIRSWLVSVGLVASTADIDDCATAIESITNQGAVSAQVTEGDTYTIPKGYHNGSGTVSGVAGGGNYSLQSKTVTPTKTQQNVTPDSGYYGISDVTVGAIPENYQDVTPVTAGAADVLANKVIVDASGKSVAGTMPNNGAVALSVSVSTPSVTVPKGYHSGAGTVSITPEEKSVTPTKSAQEITPATGKVLSKVTVDAIPAKYQDISVVTASAAEVLEGKIYVNAIGQEVEGTMPNCGNRSAILDTATTSYTIPKGYHAGGGDVHITLEEKSATPSKDAQTITPSGAKVLKKVTVAAIPDAYQDVTGVTAAAAAVLDGSIFVDATGAEIEGTMPNNGATSKSIDGLSVTSVSIPAGYTSGGSVSLTNDIETALAAI